MSRQFASVGLALALLVPDLALAKGGYVRPPQLQPFRAIIAPSLPSLSLPQVPLIRTCGPKRYLNVRTHQCQWPSDWR
jgi:hypothetical protein